MCISSDFSSSEKEKNNIAKGPIKPESPLILTYPLQLRYTNEYRGKTHVNVCKSMLKKQKLYQITFYNIAVNFIAKSELPFSNQTL